MKSLDPDEAYARIKAAILAGTHAHGDPKGWRTPTSMLSREQQEQLQREKAKMHRMLTGKTE